MPKGVLPRKKMQEVMWDMIRAGEFLNSYLFNKDTSLDKIAESQKWHNKIYQLHKITKRDFDRSYAYYESHPVLMREILDSLSKKQVQPKIPPGQGTQTSKDSMNKKDSITLKNKRKRIIDTLNRKRILKKISNTQ